MLFSNKNEPKKRAVAYFRHSAEDKQENSVGIQREHIQKFAKEHNVDVIHEEADEGVSGLTENRPAFKRLFSDWVLNNQAKFDYIFVYDISRWGRFQDPDKAASLANLCKEQGKEVVYVDKGFPQEQQKLITYLQSSIERYMSADYSRQLSNKVFYGAVKVSEQGYSAGGMACYGMTRLLLDENKKPIGPLKKGDHKVIANQRVTFAPTGDESTETIKRIFHDLVFRWKLPEEIADDLNRGQIPSPAGGLWNRSKILRILTNETYIGARIYNKTWNRLKQGKRDNPRNDWVFCYNAFPAIVDSDVFKEAQERLYFLLPRRHNRGVVLQDKINRSIKEELRSEVLSQKFDEDTSATICRHFPVTTSITFYQSGQSNEKSAKWIFSIPEEFRKFDYVIGLGISLDEKQPMREVFIFPSELFDESNLLILKEGDDVYAKCFVRKNSLKDRISEITEDVRNKVCFSLPVTVGN